MAVTVHIIALFCVFGVVFTQNNDGYLDVAAFNVKIFGSKKMKNEFVRKKLVQIISRYDLMLMQEIRDVSEESLPELMKLLREADSRYDYVVSERLGRSNSKEQYAYIYRKDWLTPVSKFVYDDDEDDVFEREPYIVHFKSSRTSIKDFVAIGIHTKPKKAVKEISGLVEVYDHVVHTLGIEDAILMGDFNTDCTYVKDQTELRLAQDTRFFWLVNDAMDTTTKDTDCAYDRFVIAGKKMLQSVVPGSTRVFHFDQEYKLTENQMIEISDHYPIQVQLFSKDMAESIKSEEELVVVDKRLNTALIGYYRKVYAIRKKAVEKGYDVSSAYTSSGAYLEVKVSKKVLGIEDAENVLWDMHSAFSSFVSKSQVYKTVRWIRATGLLNRLPRSSGKYQTLYTYYSKLPPQFYTMSIVCSLLDRVNPYCKLVSRRD